MNWDKFDDYLKRKPFEKFKAKRQAKKEYKKALKEEKLANKGVQPYKPYKEPAPAKWRVILGFSSLGVFLVLVLVLLLVFK